MIGARLYHVVTDWELFEHDLARIPQIWRGGLGIPGGMLAGAVRQRETLEAACSRTSITRS